MIEQKERKIYLKDLLSKLLSKWISILVVAIIVGAFIIIVKYKADSDNYETKIQNVETDIELEKFSESEMKNIEDYIRINDRIMYYNEYFEKSYLMNIHPTNVTKLRVRYLIDSEYSFDLSNVNEGDYTSEVIGAYTAYFSSTNFVKDIMEGLDEKYIKELVNVSYDYDIGVISIVVIIPDSITASGVLNSITEKVSSLEEKWQEIGKHTIRLVSSSEAVEYDSDLENRIYTTKKTISDAQTQLYSLETNLTDSQKQYVNKLYGIETEEQILVKPAINVKYGILGIVLGAALMMFYYIFASILSNKLQNSEDIRTMYGVNLLGKIDSNKKKTITNELAYIVSKIKVMCISKGVSKVHICGSGISKIDDEFKTTIISELKKYLDDVTIGENICIESQSLESAKNADNVILVEIIGVSYYDDIAEQLQNIYDNDITVLGAITIK